MADWVRFEEWTRDGSIPNNVMLIHKDELAAKQRDPLYRPQARIFPNPLKVKEDRKEQEEELRLIGNDYGLAALRPVVGAERYDELIRCGIPAPTIPMPPPWRATPAPVPQRSQTRQAKPQPKVPTFKTRPTKYPPPAATQTHNQRPNPQRTVPASNAQPTSYPSTFPQQTSSYELLQETAKRIAQKKVEEIVAEQRANADAAEKKKAQEEFKAAIDAANVKAAQEAKAAEESKNAILAEISKNAQPTATYPAPASQPISKEVWRLVKEIKDLPTTKTTGLPRRYEFKAMRFRDNFDQKGTLRDSSVLWQYRRNTSLLSEGQWKFILGPGGSLEEGETKREDSHHN